LVVSKVRAPGRITELDFTKGALVLIMVLYHWLNYFYAPQDSRYLRFLTPSFIFITGFLISSVYSSKYGTSDPRLPRRLTYRGLKLLALFLLLNVVITLILGGSDAGKVLLSQLSTRNAVSVFVTGNVAVAGVGRSVAFYILVPIAYLLLLSSILFVVCRFYKYAFHAVCAGCLLSILILRLIGIESANLELLTIGLLGVIVGHIPMARINTFVKHPYSLAATYAGYVAAIAVWNVTYVLQIIGVCLSLMILYSLGWRSEETESVRGRVILLGKYSLFGYVAQIAILQLLRRGFRHTESGLVVLALSFVLALTLTMVSVEVLNRARAGSTFVDRFYRLVFA
jgi:hypothetical protein